MPGGRLTMDPSNDSPETSVPAGRPVTPLATAIVLATDPVGRLVCLNDGREYPINAVPFILGRDPAAQVVLGSPDASRRHAEVAHRPDGDVLVDCSTHGTWVNGAKIAGRHRLMPLDVIRIGSEEYRYYPGASIQPGPEFRLANTLAGVPSLGLPITPIPTGKPLATLRIKRGQAKGKRFSVLGPTVTMGRAEFNDVVIDDPSISAAHARLDLNEGIWSLTDVGSTNGTTVDGVLVEDETPLSPGATIELGQIVFSFEPYDEPARAPTPAAAPPAGPALEVPNVSTPGARVARPLILLTTGRARSRGGRLVLVVVAVGLALALAALVYLV
jgi:pSer/pThr/pTyr-binding forkhead associated (FHA) protein